MMSGDNATLPRSNGGGDHDIQLRVLSNSRRRSDSDTNSDSDTDGDNGGIQLTHPTHTSNVSQDQGGTWNGNVSGAGTDSNALTANVDGHVERSSSSPRHRSASPHSDGDDVDDRSGSPGAMPIGDHPNAQPTAPTRTPSPLLTQGKLRQYGTRAFDVLFGWLVNLFYWSWILIPLGCLIGVFMATFLWTMNVVTRARFRAPWLLYLLPLSGLIQACLYWMWGSKAARGVNLVIDQIHLPDERKGRATIPTRMGVLVWIGTLLTHVCGGSAGREGTALQMAASVSNLYCRVVRRLSRGHFTFDKDTTRLVTIASLAAGFGGVFGTPFAGILFALELPVVGGLASDAVFPCFLASLSSTLICNQMLERVYFVEHMHFPPITESPALDGRRLGEVILASIGFGFSSLLFATSIEALTKLYKRLLPKRPEPFLRAFMGGCIIIAMVFIFNTRDYLGIGTLQPHEGDSTVIIQTCFEAEGPCQGYSFFLKLFFTVITLSAGYKGGEVTCLFFVGAAMGWSWASWLGRPSATSFFAALGFVGVFSGAANTPLASAIMACELFGGAHAVYYGLACYLSYAISGKEGIYSAQRRVTAKLDRARFSRRDLRSNEGVDRRPVHEENGNATSLREFIGASGASSVVTVPPPTNPPIDLPVTVHR